MYAIVKTGGKQYTVQPGDVFDVEKLAGEPGDTVSLPVLFFSDGADIVTDAEALASLKVEAQIVDQHKGKKALVFKFKKRKGYKRKKGHRQQLTRICITDVNGVKAEVPRHLLPKPEELEAAKDERARKTPEEPEAKRSSGEQEGAAGAAPSVSAPAAPGSSEDEPRAETTDAAKADTGDDLSAMTVAQLKELAKERDVVVRSGARKAEIIEAIQNA